MGEGEYSEILTITTDDVPVQARGLTKDSISPTSI